MAISRISSRLSWALCLGLIVATAGVAQARSSDYTKTRYPIVLVHGDLGFSTALGTYDYYFGVVQALERGGAQVYLAQTSALNATRVSGEQLLHDIETILALTGAEKVNLIGHSHGGHASRYAAGVRPDRVASVTTISTSHLGTKSDTDLYNEVQKGTLRGKMMLALYNGMAHVMAFLSGEPDDNDALASAASLRYEEAAAFNLAFPHGMPTAPCGEGEAEHDGQRYYSWGGVAGMTNPLDPADPFMALLGRMHGGENDGLTGRCDTHFGHVVRDNYHMNHLDTINQMFGLTDLREANPLSLFRTHANRLKNAEL
jgi:triacylglycerol lipase